MNLVTIAEHTVDMDLVGPQSIIGDLGCRGFEFTRYFRNLGHLVLAVDIDKLEGPDEYHRLAISDYNGTAGILRSNDPQATRITSHITPETGFVRCLTLDKYLENVVTPVDLIKIDCEGSEYEIIMSLTTPPARQLSIEFHLHTGSYSQPEFVLMEAKLFSLGYKKVFGNFERRHGLCENWWDSLYILE